MKKYIAAVAIRAGKTFCQSLAALLVASGTDLLNSSWVQDLSVSGMAGLLSVLTSFGQGTLPDTTPPTQG